LFPSDKSSTATALLKKLREVGIEGFRAKPTAVALGNREESCDSSKLDMAALKENKKEGVLQVIGAPFHQEDWSYYFFSLAEGILQWKQTKKTKDFTGSLDVLRSGVQFILSSENVILIQFPPDFRFSLEFESAGVLNEWFPPKLRTAMPFEESDLSDPDSLMTGSPMPSRPTSTPQLEKPSPSSTRPVSLAIHGESSRLAYLDEPENRSIADVLIEGYVFKKFKNGSSGSKRHVYCSNDLTKIAWATPGDKKSIHGFFKTSEITGIETGSGKSKMRLFIVSPERSLELEAPDTVVLAEWVKAVRLLMELGGIEREEEALRTASPESTRYFEKIRNTYKLALVKGEMFKIVTRGSSSTTKHVYFTPDMQNLAWKELDENKVLGAIPVSEIFQVISEKSKSDNKLTIVAKKKYMSLEAKDSEAKHNFINSFSYWTSGFHIDR